MVVMTDSDGTKTTHEMRVVKLKDRLPLYSSDDILRMLGYASNYSSKHNHHFVNGLRSKASCLYKLPHTLVAGNYKFWDNLQLCEVYKSFLGNGFQSNAYLDNWWMVVELIARGKPTPVKEVTKPVIPYDWYNEGDLPEVDTECEYSVSGSPFRWCTINYIGGDILVITTKTKKDVVVDLDTLELRPLDLEKKQTVAAMMEHSMAGMSLSDFSAKLFEAGYQLPKQEN
jgi:hypothetical protein